MNTIWVLLPIQKQNALEGKFIQEQLGKACRINHVTEFYYDFFALALR